MRHGRPHPPGRRHGARGQALVELAIVLPVFLFVVGAAIDLGRLFQAYVTVENAAKEGAFFGATDPRCDVAKQGCADPNTVDWHVRAEAGSVSIDPPTATCLDGGVSGAPKSVDACVEGDGYRVTVRHHFRLLTPLLSPILGSGFELTSTATAGVLNQAFDPNATPFPMPTPSQSAAPSASPSAAPSPSPTPTASPSPSPSPACVVVPDLNGLSMTAARSQWNSLFTGGFTPANGLTNKTVTGQTTSPASAPGNCIPSSASVTVTYQ